LGHGAILTVNVHTVSDHGLTDLLNDISKGDEDDKPWARRVLGCVKLDLLRTRRGDTTLDCIGHSRPGVGCGGSGRSCTVPTVEITTWLVAEVRLLLSEARTTMLVASKRLLTAEITLVVATTEDILTTVNRCGMTVVRWDLGLLLLLRLRSGSSSSAHEGVRSWCDPDGPCREPTGRLRRETKNRNEFVNCDRRAWSGTLRLKVGNEWFDHACLEDNGQVSIGDGTLSHLFGEVHFLCWLF